MKPLIAVFFFLVCTEANARIKLTDDFWDTAKPIAAVCCIKKDCRERPEHPKPKRPIRIHFPNV
jgi:hypothetical protein